MKTTILRISILFFIYSPIIHAHTILYSNNDARYTIRTTSIKDKDSLLVLYKKVAATSGGLARTEDEITDDYINKTLHNGINNGLAIVVEYEEKIIGCMTKYALGPKVFSHVLAEGSILIDPDFQGRGIGSQLIKTFQEEIKNNYPHILRVEIIARESNPAIKLYERSGFEKEGSLKKRINGTSGEFEADIPMVWFNPNFRA